MTVLDQETQAILDLARLEQKGDYRVYSSYVRRIATTSPRDLPEAQRQLIDILEV